MEKSRVAVLGASGMLGNAMFRLFGDSAGFEVFGTVRSGGIRQHFPDHLQDRLISGIDITDFDDLVRALGTIQPDVVINCVGVVKQLESAKDPLTTLPINSLLPHRLARLGALTGARIVHVSTDCVFSGHKGNYVEQDLPDATDLYGRSKLLGELEQPGTITLRTSIIGRELQGNHSLVDWFLSQNGSVKGYRRAVFSGLPTCELARVVRDYVLPRPTLSGLYHVSAAPIDKLSLLLEIAKQYDHAIDITADDTVTIDRSLDSSRFREATGYAPPAWPDLIESMRAFG